MFNIFKNVDSAGEEPEITTSGYSQWEYIEGYDELPKPIEAPINFDTLNTLTKDYYSPQARVKRMLQHAKVAAEKGSWWCNIPDVGEEEITLLKGYGFRIFKKHVVKDGRLVEQFSINWADVQPKDDSLAEVE